MKKQPKVIVLTPRFETGNGTSNFAGYNQVAGNAYFDNDGHLYAFVSVEDYNRMDDEREMALEELEEWKSVVEPLKKEVEYLSPMWHENSKLTGERDELKEALKEVLLYHFFGDHSEKYRKMVGLP
jgi:hypothetical protein